MGDIPSFCANVCLKESSPGHKYATQAKGWPPSLVQSIIAGMGMDWSDGVSSHAQHVGHCPADGVVESTSL